MSDADLRLDGRRVRFDLLTAFSALSLWAILLSAMRFVGVPAHGYAIVSLLLVVVGTARIFLRRFNHPHLVSMGAGLAFTLIGEATLRACQGLPGGVPMSLVPLGLAYGAFADIFFGAVWLVAGWMKAGFIRPQ